MALTTAASVANNIVALPREGTASLGLDDIFNYNPLVIRNPLKTIDPYYKDNDILRSLEVSNKVQTTYETTYRNYEEGPYFRPVTPLAINGMTTSGTTGGTVTMTLTAGSYSSRSTGASATGGTSALYTSLMKADFFRTYNGLVGYVQAKTGSGTSTVFTIERAVGNNADLAEALRTHVTNSIPLGVLGNMFAEGSLQPTEGLSRRNVFHMNQTAIIKTHRAVTGSANASRLLTVRGEERPIETQKVEMSFEHRVKEAMMLFWGTGESWSDPSEGIPTVKMTKGVDGSIREMGNVYQYATSTGYLEADFDATLAQIERVRGGNEYQIFAGSRMYGYLQTIFKAKIAGLPGANYTFQSFGASNGKEKAIEIGFNTFIVNGITFHLIRSDMFNIDGMTDILGYNYPYMAFWVPGEMQAVDGNFIQNGAKVTRTLIPALVACYTSQEDDTLRRYKYWKRGVEITNRDESQQELLTEVGARLTMTRKYFLTEGVS